ncbi:MAG: 3'-5' exonuclease [Gemmataceae bacterium]
MGTADDVKATAYLVLDTESVPDGRLINLVKFAGQQLMPHHAVSKFQEEQRERTGSDFLPVSFQYPVSVCVARVAADFSLLAVTCLDAPQFRPREIVCDFWRGFTVYERAQLVSFYGGGFDLPLMELAAFRFGCNIAAYIARSRHRYLGHIDLLDWLTNFGAYRLAGGLNLLSKLLGKPGKMEVAGHQVYEFFCQGKLQEINDYCLADTLDTYFIFLRTRVLTGEVSLEREAELVRAARKWLDAAAPDSPAIQQYLANWGNWDPWP